MSVKDIGQSSKFPEECVIMGIYRGENDEFFIPRGNNVIREGDELFLISKSQHMKAATDFLKRKGK